MVASAPRTKGVVSFGPLTAIDGLVAKSMIATRPVGVMIRYRLLDTTRAYVLDISRDNGEFGELARRHAARVALARTLWVQGYPVQAMECASETIAHSERMDHPASVVVVLAWAASVFLWCGDLEAAARHIHSSVATAESHSLGPLIAVGNGCKGQLAVRLGSVHEGVEALRSSLTRIQAGRLGESAALIEGTIRRVETNGERLYMPELLRLRAGLLSSKADPAFAEAETCLLRSLDMSQRQGALGWRLRAATDLASLQARCGQNGSGREAL